VTVIVAHRASGGTLVFGADQKFSSPDGDHFARKLSSHPTGQEIQSELRRLRAGNANETAADDVEILLGIASPALPQPKLIGIAGREIKDLGDAPFCCIGSGRGAAGGFLKLVSDRLCDLRMAQAAVCAAVWLAKRSDSLCGGDTNIVCLRADGRPKEVEEQRIKAFESSLATSLSDDVVRWMANTSF